MDINRADYGAVIRFGSIELLKEKMKLETQTINEIKNVVDKNGMSLLEKSLISRKFEITNYLLDNNANVNIISNEGYNELHYLSANINFEGAIHVGNRLLDLNVNLNVRDKKNGNTPLWYLCQEVLKKRTDDGILFIVKCLRKNPNVTLLNNFGDSVENLIRLRGTEQMRTAMEELLHE